MAKYGFQHISTSVSMSLAESCQPAANVPHGSSDELWNIRSFPGEVRSAMWSHVSSLPYNFASRLTMQWSLIIIDPYLWSALSLSAPLDQHLLCEVCKRGDLLIRKWSTTNLMKASHPHDEQKAGNGSWRKVPRQKKTGPQRTCPRSEDFTGPGFFTFFFWRVVVRIEMDMNGSQPTSFFVMLLSPASTKMHPIAQTFAAQVQSSKTNKEIHKYHSMGYQNGSFNNVENSTPASSGKEPTQAAGVYDQKLAQESIADQMHGNCIDIHTNKSGTLGIYNIL